VSLGESVCAQPTPIKSAEALVFGPPEILLGVTPLVKLRLGDLTDGAKPTGETLAEWAAMAVRSTWCRWTAMMKL